MPLKKWFRIFAFPSLVHIADMTGFTEDDIYDPRIDGDGNIIIQPLEEPLQPPQ